MSYRCRISLLVLTTVASITCIFILYSIYNETSLTTYYTSQYVVGIISNIDIKPLTEAPTQQNSFQQILEIQKHLPNLPITFWDTHKSSGWKLNTTCAHLPNLLDYVFSNRYWQTVYTTNGTLQIFGAYHDTRKLNHLGPTIRILSMINRMDPNITAYCQIWFNETKQPAIVPIVEYKFIWNKAFGYLKNGKYQPYFLSCVLPHNFANYTPQAVSIVENPCDDATNSLRVIYNRPVGGKKDFAVCVKGLDFMHVDLSIRIGEWVELLNQLGADKVFIYNFQSHPNITKVLEYYQRKGVVEVSPLSLAGGEPNAPYLQHYFLGKKNMFQFELIPYHDCFYKHMYEYRYIALFDIDEVIVPVNGSSWGELMDVVRSKAGNETIFASYYARNVYFFDEFVGSYGDIPGYMHMLRHVYRSANFTKPGHYVKAFFDTEVAFTLHNHFPFSALVDKYSTYAIEEEDAYLHHYRGDCVSELSSVCKDFKAKRVRDVSVWRYKNVMVENVGRMMRELGFLPKVL